MNFRNMSDLKSARRIIGAWGLFDFANSILVINGGLYFSQWLADSYVGGESWFNYSLAITSFIVLITGPIIGAIGDRKNSWMKILWLTTALMSFCTLGIAILPRVFLSGALLLLFPLILFCLINYCYQISTLFYNSLLGKIAKPEAYARVSGFGGAMGWSGAIFGLGVILPFAEGKIKLFRSIPNNRQFYPCGNSIFHCYSDKFNWNVKPQKRR